MFFLITNICEGFSKRENIYEGRKKTKEEKKKKINST
jgi:hypothetical protein